MSDAATPARRAAFEVVRRVFEHDAWADRAFPAAAERHALEPRERAQAQRLAYGAVQRRGTADALINQLAGRRVETLDPPVAAALRLGLFELLFSAAVADHAAVDGSVELAKGGMRRGGGRRAAGAAGLVNAVLRRAASERVALLASLRDDDPAGAAVAHSVPEWLAAMWWKELGEESARRLLGAVNDPPETALRANPLRADPAELRAELEAAGEPVAPAGDGSLLQPRDAVVWAGPLGEAALAALGSGRLIAQSRAAQAVAALLDPLPGERVLDLCAGPGVKTTALAARMGGEGELVAVERDPGRARQITELCDRAGAGIVQVVTAHASSLDSGPGYDRVLVDPPCSDLGTLASRPDARWRKDPATIERLAFEQARILAAGIAALRTGGTLVYSTCTISRRENEDVVGAALDAAPGVVTDDLGTEWHGLSSPHDARFLQTRPDRDSTDGFFYARLRGGG